MFDVKRRRVLVTGSTQGIGKCIAVKFLEAGADVWIHGSKREKTERIARETGMGCKAVWADLSDADCAETIYARTGDVDVLILNASIQKSVEKYYCQRI